MLKKYIIIGVAIVALIFGLRLAGCSKKDAHVEENNTNSVPVTEQTTQVE